MTRREAIWGYLATELTKNYENRGLSYFWRDGHFNSLQEVTVYFGLITFFKKKLLRCVARVNIEMQPSNDSNFHRVALKCDFFSNGQPSKLNDPHTNKEIENKFSSCSHYLLIALPVLNPRS